MPLFLSSAKICSGGVTTLSRHVFWGIGGLTPLVAVWLVERRGDWIAPAFLVMASVTVTTVPLTRFRETYRRCRSLHLNVRPVCASVI